MDMTVENSQWVFVMVQDSGTDSQIIGQIDQENRINFIPTFLSREAAEQAAFFFPKEKGKKIEIQAIIFEDLSRYASSNDFLIFILDENGKILNPSIR